jgi:hypothetical protein
MKPKFTREEWDLCIAQWRFAEQWERKYGWPHMADVIANTIKELEIERDTGEIVHINKRCGVGGPVNHASRY